MVRAEGSCSGGGKLVAETRQTIRFASIAEVGQMERPFLKKLVST